MAISFIAECTGQRVPGDKAHCKRRSNLEGLEEGLKLLGKYILFYDPSQLEIDHRRIVQRMGSNFVVRSGYLLRRTPKGPNLVAQQKDRVSILSYTYASLGHWDVRTTNNFVKDLIWWAYMIEHTVKFVLTFHTRQEMGPLPKYMKSSESPMEGFSI